MTDDIETRWSGFIEQVRQRVAEMMAEADAGFDQIIAVDVTDIATISGAVAAFESRMNGLKIKVTGAQSKLALQANGRNLDSMLAQGDLLQHEISTQSTEMTVKKRAKAASMLWLIAEQELNLPRHCVSCGGVMQMKVLHTSSSPTCPFCKTVNQIQPAQSVTNYYYGGAVAAQAESQAVEKWRKMNQLEFHHEQVYSESTQQAFRHAAEAYWTNYFTAFANMHPDWDLAQVPLEVRGKLSWLQ